MRLICPNCGAQYEVTADVIPAAGRDVQCSNCGHTWFETPGASEAAEAEAQAKTVEMPAADEPDTPPPASPAPADPPQMAPPAPAPVPAPEPTLSAAPQRPPPPAPDAPAPQRPQLDNAIADMLREEAAREEAIRAAEAGSGLEGQTELGLDSMPTMTAEKRAEGDARVDALTGQAATAAAATAGSRRELLPNIDEINSTLRSDAERSNDNADNADALAEKRGFRFGFTMMMTFFIVLVAIYLLADQISAAVPALEGTMTVYVDTVDSMRLWLDAQVEKVLVMVEQTDDSSAGS